MAVVMIADRNRTIIASLSDDVADNTYAEGASGDAVREWVEQGVPSLQGVKEGDGVIEKPILVDPSDNTWGLAVLEECERRGWITGSIG